MLGYAHVTRPARLIRPGMVLDLAGDPYADPAGWDARLGCEPARVARVERETPACVALDLDHGSVFGMPPDHLVRVVLVPGGGGLDRLLASWVLIEVDGRPEMPEIQIDDDECQPEEDDSDAVYACRQQARHGLLEAIEALARHQHAKRRVRRYRRNSFR